ncbi:MAG: YitT family protein [Clostridia bacterium]
MKEKLRKIFEGVEPINFVFLIIAGFINAVGVNLFLTPVSIYDGGFSGTSILLYQVSHLNIALWLVILNFPFFIFGAKRLGLPFVLYSLCAVSVYSFFTYVFQNLAHIDFSLGSPIAKNDLLLCAIFGGLISGVGSGLTIRFGGAIDGVEVMAVLFAKRIGLTVGTFVMIYNTIIYVIAGVIFKSYILPLYSILAYAIGVKTVDFIIDGIDKTKSAFIISDRLDNSIAKALSDAFGRGVTILNAKGYYSKKDKCVLYCVVNRFEVSKLKKIVIQLDHNAFVAITDVSDSLAGNFKRRRSRKKKNQLPPAIDDRANLTPEQTMADTNSQHQPVFPQEIVDVLTSFSEQDKQ